jgi:O6-methylguanine-DNA--protein-cysteine methyltransferase
MAYGMVQRYGMSDKVCLVNFGDQEAYTKPFGEHTEKIMDEEARQIIEEQYNRAKALIEEKKHLIDLMAQRLYEKETLVYQDILEILGPRPYGMNKNYEKFVKATSTAYEDIENAADEKNAAGEDAESNNKSDSTGGSDDGKKKEGDDILKDPAPVLTQKSEEFIK